MRKLPMYPTFDWYGKKVMIKLEPKEGNENCYLHFIVEHSRDEHIGGFSLFNIDNDGMYLEPGVDTDFDMDLDWDNDESMKIIGVDLV